MSKRYWGYMYTTIKRSKYAVVCRCRILGMQIWNFRYANMDFFKTPHIQIWFLGKDTVFKYEFMVLFSHPWPAQQLPLCGLGSREHRQGQGHHRDQVQFPAIGRRVWGEGGDGHQGQDRFFATSFSSAFQFPPHQCCPDLQRPRPSPPKISRQVGAT